MRVVGVVAGTNVLRGLPVECTSVGAALVDTASELATAVGIAAGGTILSALVAGSITSARATAAGAEQLSGAVGVAGLVLAGLAAALVALGVLRSRTSPSEQ